MMFDKKKKEKLQKQKRNNLRMFPHLLQQPSSILLKIYPNIYNLNMLKIVTNIHMNYLIFTYIDAINKANQINETNNKVMNYIGIQNIKIGIIGGGVMGRLFLNGLLVLQKEGLEPSNISLSTRQYEDLEYYKTNFNVKIEFNNEKLAEESDILIITVPATLDNWVIADLKQPLSKRITRQGSASMTTTTTSINNTGPINNIKTNNNTINTNSIANSNKATKGVSITVNNTIKNTLNPLVYITTSNMTEQKLNKLFNFPILTPIIRGEQAQYIKELVEINIGNGEVERQQQLEEIQKYLKNKMRRKHENLKETLYFILQNYVHAPQKESRTPSLINSERQKKESKTLNINQRISNQQKPQSMQSSMNVASYGSTLNTANSYIQQTIKNLVDQILEQKQSLEQTFLMRCRKWRMAYNNYIA